MGAALTDFFYTGESNCQPEEEILSNMRHHCDYSNDSTSKHLLCSRLRRSLSTSALSSLQNLGLNSDTDMKLHKKGLVMQNEVDKDPPSVYLTPPKVMASGGLVSLVSSSDPIDCHTPPENLSSPEQLSAAALSTSRKRKLDEVSSCEYDSHVADRLESVGKKSTSLDQLPLSEGKEKVQSLSNQADRLSFKKVKFDVLKDRTNTLMNFISKCQTVDQCVCSKEKGHTHCASCQGSSQESDHSCILSLLMQELSQKDCASDVERTQVHNMEMPVRCMCHDVSDVGYCADATVPGDIGSALGGFCSDAPASGNNSSIINVEEMARRACLQDKQQSETKCKPVVQTQTGCWKPHNGAEGPIYPRPLNSTSVLTRRQFENRVRSVEGKSYLRVEDILSSGDDFLGPDFRTRAMKGKIWNLKKLLQDMKSYPTVVLHRVDDIIQEKTFQN